VPSILFWTLSHKYSDGLKIYLHSGNTDSSGGLINLVDDRLVDLDPLLDVGYVGLTAPMVDEFDHSLRGGGSYHN